MSTTDWLDRLRERALAPVAHGSPAWHEHRRAGIGGSDAPIILGESPWTTRDQLRALKRGRATPRPETRRSEALMGIGQLLEAAILARYAPDALPGDAIGQIADLEQPYLRAHIDGIVPSDGAIVEVKTSGRPWQGGAMPDHYLAQVQHYMTVTGAALCHLIHWHTPHDRVALYAHLVAETLTPEQALELGSVQRCTVTYDARWSARWRVEAARFWAEVSHVQA